MKKKTPKKSRSVREHVKDHVKVKFTRKMLEEYDPCDTGLEEALSLLPATLSTNPEDNYALALTIAQSERALIGGNDAYWLVIEATRQYGVYVDADYRYGDPALNDWWPDRLEESTDPFLIAQYLAMVADHLATGQGK